MAEDDPWGNFDDAVAEESTTQPESIEGGGGLAAAAASGVPEEASPEDHLPPVDDGYRKPVTLYKHWVRPKFLQYNYLYDYRQNYYNDVIDYLDKRSRGVNAEIPKAQYWAERVLRTYTSRPSFSELCEKQRHESHIKTFTSNIKFHNYHTRAYINRKYSSVL